MFSRGKINRHSGGLEEQLYRCLGRPTEDIEEVGSFYRSLRRPLGRLIKI